MRLFGSRIVEIWQRVRKSIRFHNALIFLGFVAIATIFWVIMSLNDSLQRSVTLRLEIENVPDSVTFITLPPNDVHVVVRDRGASLMRLTALHTPALKFNFRDFSNDGVFRLTSRDIQASLKSTFGSNATILANSLDSLRLTYTTGKGKSVPLQVSADVSASAGNILEGMPKASVSRVTVYGDRAVLDTLTRVFTHKVVHHNIGETTIVEVGVKPIAGVRIEPSKVKVTIAVEPLVAKEFTVPIEAVDVPDGVSLILFPERVKVACFVPMSKFGSDNPDFKLYVSYADISDNSLLLPVRIGRQVPGVLNPKLVTDSVEYTIVR